MSYILQQISLYIINLDNMYTNVMLREKTSGKIGWGFLKIFS